jgi:hypothetical protein
MEDREHLSVQSVDKRSKRCDCPQKVKFLVKFQLQSLVWHESILASVVDIIIEREDRQDIASRMEHRFAVVTNDRDKNGNVGETRFSRPQYRVKVAIIDQSTTTAGPEVDYCRMFQPFEMFGVLET